MKFSILFRKDFTLGAYSKCNVMMTVFTFLGPSWMIRSYSIPSSAMSQPHWYNWYCCSTRMGRTDRQTWGWGTARGRRDWLFRLHQKFPDKPRPVTRKSKGPLWDFATHYTDWPKQTHSLTCLRTVKTHIQSRHNNSERIWKTIL